MPIKHINNIPIDVLFNIWTFGGTKTLFFSQELYRKIKTHKKNFIENPLIVKYNLVEIRKCIFRYRKRDGWYNNEVSRPTFYERNTDSIALNGQYPLGFIINDSIQLSRKLYDELIPCSTINTNSTTRSDKVIYFILRNIQCDDKRKKIYSLLFPYKKLAIIETF